ncbi:beta,beta-carotene 9',10'-dioxygenase [Fistulifera solaris]|uniref:Beta,beta-carotene 9',10'-dioxygenase n=1 Tax=Fistulifera solaris TaxID=1519565 RepID=A0A1Z5KKS9_FISSO|nr:beta,beta-carotene 9',10'-dioxygenase [Fistulifera solaris]|eukprot:GAX26797.1 beta,beta-carotene 9',10'-dioxygenase [Fistulifera solaris]
MISVSRCVGGFTLPTTFQQTNHHHKDVNFVDWITSAPDEINEWKKLTEIEGTFPPDLPSGILIRNGAGLWEIGKHTQYSHIFDGLAKLSGYRWDGQHVSFQTKFVQTNFYKKVKEKSRLVPTISTGRLLRDKKRLEGTWWQIAQAIYHSVTFDNTCVNVWQYDSQGPITTITDAPPRSQIHPDTLDTLSSSATASPLQKGPRLQYEFLETAHPAYSWTDPSVTYNVAVTLTTAGPHLVLVHEQKGVRTAVASVPSPDGVPYVHSFGLTDRHAIVVVQTLRINVQDVRKMVTDGFLRSMKETDTTRILVWDLETQQIVVDQTIEEKIFFYHTVSATTEKDSVRIRLCAYRTPDIITSENHFMRLEQCQNSREARNRISRGGTFCDVICTMATQQVQVRWIPTSGQGFELPTTRYSRQPGNPRYVYAYGTYFGCSDEYDAWGLIKYEPDQSNEKKRIAAYFREESVYPSEPVFVPLGNKSEDDGILLSQIYDGKRRETALLMLDARTMKVLCKVWTGQRSAMDFHGWWYPEKDLRFRV